MNSIMNEFLTQLQQHIEIVEDLSDKIEIGDDYLEQLKGYLPLLNQMIHTIFSLKEDPQVCLQIDLEYVMRVLKDILYGIEQDDRVFLLDSLRYGLLEIYYYIGAEVQDGALYE